MDVIELTRQLGAAIQADEKYQKFAAAKKAADEDDTVQAQLAEIEKIRTEYQEAAMAENPDDARLSKLDQEFQMAYAGFMGSETMESYENARAELDAMMNYIMQILYLSVNGEDPATCEPPEEHDCGGECSACAGC